MAFFRSRETPADDNARTTRFLDGLEAAYEQRRGGEDVPLTQFEEVVLDASVTLSGEPYPPAGHTYPRKG
ncbi:hypothetical protein [Streptomyces sp. NPDC051657]|uniref:hypothetical protein n=1 Tax=unclassified Streptomyces TaxID=2593676 RepID=UPI003440A6C4